MSKTDKTRPYWVRLEDAAEKQRYSYGHGHYQEDNLLNYGCKNTKCSCKAYGWYDGKRATTRRQRHNKRRDIEERNESN
jgi:hypothetical protein